MAEPGGLAGPNAASRGPRRSPTTGHVRRRHTPEKRKPSGREDETTEDSEEPVVKPRAKSLAPDERGFSRISTSEDDDDWQNRSRRKTSAPETQETNVPKPAEKKKTGGILRKLSSEKTKAPPKQEEPAPEMKSAVRRRVRSKSRGRHSPVEELVQPSLTSSGPARAKAKAEAGIRKASAWWKLGQGPLPSNKQVSSIDPQEVLRGFIPEVPPVEPEPQPPKKRWWRFWGEKPPKSDEPPVRWYHVLRDVRLEWKAFKTIHAEECNRMKLLWNHCMASLLLMMIYCGLGGFLFRFIEGAFESFYKCGVKRVKRDFIDSLWTWSHSMREDEWKSKARRKLWEFEEQLHSAHEAGVSSYSGQKSWSFLNSVLYCITIVSTMGYGHISPSTTTGRAVTIVYAIFGIPLFLIVLADFGKLFTRSIKFVWSFVRRLYYTGSCRKVRRTQGVQDVMKGVQMVYDLAMFRRPSQIFVPPTDAEGKDGAGEPLRQTNLTAPNMNQYPQTHLRPWPPQTAGTLPPGAEASDTPVTPAPSAFEVDDEFNLPISVAFVLLLLYIFIGAAIFYVSESWGFFESFYFVFISMSTIGFGDFVPHADYMMITIVYLVFGLALTSMCINVIQEKLSDTFRHASAKIGATIGLRMAQAESANAAAADAGIASSETGEESIKKTAADADSTQVTVDS